MNGHKLILLFTLSILSACGGGGSSSGGGQIATPPPTPSITPGTYGGTQTATLSIPSRPDIAPETDTSGFLAEVTPTTITILDTDISDATGMLDTAGNFGIPDARVAFTLDDGTPCMGQLGYNGRVSENSLTGSQVGSVNCGGLTFSLTATFTATEGAPAGKYGAGELLGILQKYANRKR